MKITRLYSPNHYNGRCGWKADIISFHQSGGNKTEPAVKWYMNPNSQCCPHFLIEENGNVIQFIDLNDASWCNGTNTKQGDKLWYGYALSDIVKQRKTNANFYTYSIEFVHCAAGEITEAQKAAVVELIGTVIFPDMMAHGVKPIVDRAHFVGHTDISPKTRDPQKANCPGKKFPYDEIIARVKGEKIPTKPTVKPTKPATPTKSIDEVAKEVIQGKWGAGAERKEKLTTAGYDYRAVQARVNEMLTR